MNCREDSETRPAALMPRPAKHLVGLSPTSQAACGLCSVLQVLSFVSYHLCWVGFGHGAVFEPFLLLLTPIKLIGSSSWTSVISVLWSVLGSVSGASRFVASPQEKCCHISGFLRGLLEKGLLRTVWSSHFQKPRTTLTPHPKGLAGRTA